MKQVITDRVAVGDYYCQSPVFSGHAVYPKSADDFGAENTIGLHMRRIAHGKDRDISKDFGLYLGQHNGKTVIAIKEAFMRGITAVELFDTLDECKVEWELD